MGWPVFLKESPAGPGEGSQLADKTRKGHVHLHLYKLEPPKILSKTLQVRVTTLLQKISESEGCKTVQNLLYTPNQTAFPES